MDYPNIIFKWLLDCLKGYDTFITGFLFFYREMGLHNVFHWETVVAALNIALFKFLFLQFILWIPRFCFINSCFAKLQKIFTSHSFLILPDQTMLILLFLLFMIIYKVQPNISPSMQWLVNLSHAKVVTSYTLNNLEFKIEFCLNSFLKHIHLHLFPR